jgi:hypothetical protein
MLCSRARAPSGWRIARELREKSIVEPPGRTRDRAGLGPPKTGSGPVYSVFFLGGGTKAASKAQSLIIVTDGYVYIYRRHHHCHNSGAIRHHRGPVP